MTKKDFERIISKPGNTLIVFDTNVLFSLAEYSLYTSRNLLSIFNECLDMVWLPHQVYIEYELGKKRVFEKAQKKFLDLETEFKNEIDTAKRKISNTLKKARHFSHFDESELIYEIDLKMAELNTLIDDFKDQVKTEYIASRESRPDIFDDIEKFVESLDAKQQVGRRISLSEKIKEIQEGELRYRYGIPPGYEDSAKNGQNKFGDFFIWKEILRIPKDADKTDLLFITNDLKSDWWEDLKTYQRIRGELLMEFQDVNPNTNITFLTTSQFHVLSSEFFGLSEESVFIELNKDDDVYFNAIYDSVIDDLYNELNNNLCFYLDQNSIGSEGIEDLEFLYDDLELTSVNKQSDSIYEYVIQATLNASCYSFEYWGRDEDTREVYRSPANYHEFSGGVSISVIRMLQTPDDIDNTTYSDFQIIDFEFEEIKLVTWGETEYISDDYESSLIKPTFECPACGQVKEIALDAGNGFCTVCTEWLSD